MEIHNISHLSIPGADWLRVTPDQVAHGGLGVGNPLEAEILARAVLALELLDGAPHPPGLSVHRDISPGPEDLETEEENTETLHAPCCQER